MDEETISLATLRAYLWYAANMDIFLQSIALSASHVPFIKEAKKEKQIIQDFLPEKETVCYPIYIIRVSNLHKLF